MPVITSIEDLKRIYKRRVPKMFYDYAESGSWTEQTFRENSSDFDQIRLRQRVAVDMTGRSTQSEMIGEKVRMPVALAPVGSTGMQCADGEIKAARAAEAFGVPFTLSTMSINSIEEVAEATTKPFWFQLYTMKDLDFTSRLIERARAARCSALVITLDLQILGQRHKDLKNGLSAPPKLTPATMLNLSTKWGWCMGMAGAKRRNFGNLVGHVHGVTDLASLGSYTAEQFDPALDWDKVAKLKEQWGGKVILKGILDPEDAKMALKVGADAIVVSNHGGRQLDGALSSIRMLDPILQAVGNDTEVHLDSGIRSGQDVLKALAMGAKGTHIGRAFVYGLGAMGQEGVTAALEVIEKELDVSMALCGRRRMDELDRDILLIPEDFEGRWQ
ncbi:alpha-hydroxy acid oxidase [Primorskyibacter flagellatus]|uniref:L-lactate dehydrogenase (Cytochrome) n=1 Tax=Primorskyibacter flagellatus TaxID=1387277 RepID=A0A1W2D1C6_9RHOB|nr:alpha-hydroxy acid oxidase [Primorskyibacter flagellatus]SMC90808.1 L-lactate dehydrogenase (cytochrome) [Primorskyibacter flagellatus]